MDYQAFTNDSLTMMYEAIRGALLADDEFSRLGGEPRFRVRETPEWKTHAGALEAEMLRRGMFFQIIDWSEGPGEAPGSQQPWLFENVIDPVQSEKADEDQINRDSPAHDARREQQEQSGEQGSDGQ